jgi:hypothetical protein
VPCDGVGAVIWKMVGTVTWIKGVAQNCISDCMPVSIKVQDYASAATTGLGFKARFVTLNVRDSCNCWISVH